MYSNQFKKLQKKKNADKMKRNELLKNTYNQIRCPTCNSIFTRIDFEAHSSNCDNIVKYDLAKSVKSIIDPDIQYNDFLKNKRVVLIAPSKSILKMVQGDHIDSYDIVIRLNKSLPVPKHLYQYIGSKTDILYNNLNLTDFPGENILNMSYLKNNISYLCCPYPPITPFGKDIEYFKKHNTTHNIPFHHINFQFYNSIVNNIKTRPNTGICAILDVLNKDIKELYITGVTFFSDGHYSEYRNVPLHRIQTFANNGIIHSQEPQIDLMRRLVLTDDRIIIDRTLENILFGLYDNVIKTLEKFSFKHCFGGPKQEILNKSFLDVIKNKPSTNIYIKFHNVYDNESMQTIKNIITNTNDYDVNDKSIIVTIHNNDEIKLNIMDTDIICSLRIMEEKRYTEELEYIYYLNGIFTKYVVKQLKRIKIINISVELFTLLYFTTLFPKHYIYADQLKTNYNEVYFYKYLLRKNMFNKID
jgi:hypothetical protein